MSRNFWDELCLPPGDEGLWEIFHENSKLGAYDRFLPDELMASYMVKLSESLSFETYPEVALPSTLAPLDLSLAEAITARETARQLSALTLTQQNLATILHYGYGVTRDNEGTIFQRAFRAAPSADAFYPLEIFFHSTRVGGLTPGLYHYNPTRNSVRLLSVGDHSGVIAAGLVQKPVAINSSLIIFVTAMFERTTLKYGNRGYRFVLLEAGHVAQNINLVAAGLGLGCLNIGGYFDHNMDEMLGLDGVTHSTVYMLSIGGKVDDPVSPEES